MRRNGRRRRIAQSHHTAATAAGESADSATPENHGQAGAPHKKYSDHSAGAARSTRRRFLATTTPEDIITGLDGGIDVKSVIHAAVFAFVLAIAGGAAPPLRAQPAAAL